MRTYHFHRYSLPLKAHRDDQVELKERRFEPLLTGDQLEIPRVEQTGFSCWKDQHHAEEGLGHASSREIQEPGVEAA